MGLRGQCIWSNRTIKKDLGIYKSVVKRFLCVRQIVEVLNEHFAQGLPHRHGQHKQVFQQQKEKTIQGYIMSSSSLINAIDNSHQIM